MSITYTPTPVHHATLTLPTDGDDANAQSVNAAAFKYLGDDGAFLKTFTDVFVNGGTFSPSSPVIFSGSSTYTFTQPVQIQGSFVVDGQADFNSYFNVWGPAQFQGSFYAANNVQVSGNITGYSDGSIASNFTVGGNIVCDQDLTVANAFTANSVFANSIGGGFIIISGTGTFSGNVTIGGGLVVGGSVSGDNVTCTVLSATIVTGKKIWIVADGGNVNGVTYQGAQFDTVRFSTLTANRSCTIGSVGASEGMEIEFTTTNTAFTVTIFGIAGYPGGFPLTANPPAGPYAHTSYIKVVYAAGAWREIYSAQSAQ